MFVPKQVLRNLEQNILHQIKCIQKSWPSIGSMFNFTPWFKLNTSEIEESFKEHNIYVYLCIQIYTCI